MSLGRRLAKRSIGRWIWLENYRCLRLAWKDALTAAAALAAPADAVDFRLLQRSELQRYGEGADYDFSGRFLGDLASRDDLCFGAFAASRLASYCFFALVPTAIDAYLRFYFPERWIYVYKAFTHPSWRGRRLQQETFLRALPHVRKWVHGMRDPLGFVTLVVADNRPSLSAFSRLGFLAFDSFPVLRVRSRPRWLPRLQDAASAFHIRKEDT